MSRVQLALNVSDIDAAVDFYSKLFGAEPAKRRPGYANFAIAEPPLKLVLIESPAARGARRAGALNHLGVEVEHARRGGRRHRAPLGRGPRARRPGGHHLLLRRPGQGVGRTTRTAPRGRSTPCWPTRRSENGLGCSTEGCSRHAGATIPSGPPVHRPLLLSAQRPDPSRPSPSERSRAVAPADRRVPRQRLPGRSRHRLGHRRPAALAGQRRACELFENAAATGAGLYAIILMFGPVSGAHFNPVVSFVDAAFGGISWRDACAYLPAQVVGCIGGAVVANLMFSKAAVSISTHHRATARPLPVRDRGHPRSDPGHLRPGP